MTHVLARLIGVELEDVKKVLKADASKHAEQGLYLEHLWRSLDDSQEVLFLFRVNNLCRAKQFVEMVFTEAIEKDPKYNLSHLPFLDEEQL
jgi:hypothetical protein